MPVAIQPERERFTDALLRLSPSAAVRVATVDALDVDEPSVALRVALVDRGKGGRRRDQWAAALSTARAAGSS